MRPVSLSVSGLNSFKEEQSIDFSAICDGSVFGIFGPTGSGKSTVIDAITLALYGKVERSPRGLQGIVNKTLDAAFVDFTFALGTAEGEKTYRVERKYVSKDDAVTCRLARLTCVSGETPEVLADKVTLVDAHVVSILGLTVEDFTRAVVLPQGKFAEFLSLRGADRRDMLERIFGLGEYGERLIAVVQSELRSTDARIRELEIMVKGLGDADGASVNSAEEALLRACADVTEKQTSLAEVEGARESAKKIVELQEALHKVEKHRAELTTHDARIEKLADALTRVQRAIGMEQLVEDAEAANQLLTEALQRQVDTETAEAGAAQVLTLAESTSRAAEDLLKVNEPLLQRKLVDAERAEVLERQLSRIGEELKQGTDVFAQAVVTHQELEERNENLSRADVVLSESLDLLKKELDSLRVESHVRVALSKAEIANQRLAQAQQRLQEMSRQRGAKLLANRSAGEALASAEAVLAAVSARSAELGKARLKILSSAGLPEETALTSALRGFSLAMQQVDTARRTTAELESQLAENQGALQVAEEKLNGLREEEITNQTLLQQLTVSLTDTESKVAELRRRVMAESLARDLAAGAPCPVCGAVDHPSPALGDDVLSLDSAEGDLRDLRGEQNRVFTHVTALRERSATTRADLARLRDENTRLEARLQGEADTLNGALRRLPKESLEDGYVESLNVDLDAVATKLADARQRAEHSTANFTRLREELAEIDASYTVIRREAEAEHATVSELRTELGGGDIAAFAADVATRDHKIDGVSRIIRLKEQEGESTRQQMRLAAGPLAEIRTQLRELELNVEALRKQHLAHGADLSALTAGMAAEDFRRKAEAELRALRVASEEASQTLRISREDHALCKREQAVASEAAIARCAGADKLNKRVVAALASHGFKDVTDWREAIKQRNELEVWKHDVEQHRADMVLCGNEASRLTRDLAGRSISTGEWQSLTQQLDEHAARFEAAVGCRGRAEAALADTRRRSSELVAIKTEERPLRKRKGLLDEIASLLRGNALVEFMAAEHLFNIAGVATGWLRHLSRNRYALEVAPDGGFLIRDDAEGGMLRPVFTLSGGETFLTSLALALALSSQIQLRGRYPLEFFFLDEGFGTLDPELLDVVMSSLERMQGQNVSIGIISHVPELRERIQRKITVIPAESGGRGSRLVVS